MAYEAAALQQQEPTDLVMEHRSLMQWLAEDPRRGHLELSGNRWVNLVEGFALYYIDALGMGDGICFALVREQNIIVFDAWCDSVRGTMPKVCEVSIGRVSVPEHVSWSRSELVNFIEASFSSYMYLEEFPFTLPFYEPYSISFQEVRWEMRA